MKEYIDALKRIFDPVAIFIKDEEFIVIVKDEINVNEKVKELYGTIDGELSLMLLTKAEYEKLEDKELGEKLV
ncbi:MAG: hypothetical protein ABDH59_01655 [Fervidobacterium sp.]